MVWMTAAEALEILTVRPQTLYANVSRGKIRAKADDADTRRSLYHRDDVLRMAGRANGRRRIDAVSAQAMQWGDPVLPSSISTAAGGGLLYRGRDAVVLAESASLEDVAALLWECEPALVGAARPAAGPVAGAPAAPPGLSAALLAMATLTAGGPPSLGRSADDLRADAAVILATLTDAIAGAPRRRDGGRGGDVDGDDGDADCDGDCDGDGAPTISARLARAWRCQPHQDLIRRALVLMADHELNASTFATRVAVSTGASLSAGVLAGLATLTGPLHGGAPAQLARLLALAGDVGARAAVAQWLADGRPLPGFGHRLYPEGDPRAQALLKVLPQIQPYAELAAAAEAQAGELPTVDFALSLLADACGLAPTAPLMLFAVGRCAGWLAHGLEQARAGRPIRPRARYVGPV